MAKNQFEASARRKKVRALTLYFDIAFARLDTHPFEQPDRVIRALREMTEEQFALHCILAAQKPPHDGKRGETFSELIAVYAARDFESKNIVAARRIGAN